MILFFITAALAGIAIAIASLVILYYAISTIFDWIVETFGRK